MKDTRFTIETNEQIAKDIFRMILCGDASLISRGGQFVDIMLPGKFLRRPLAAMDWSEEHLTVVYKTVGNGTAQMSSLAAGTVLDVLLPLGNGFDASKCREKALVVSGGLGASPVYGLVRELLAAGREVKLVMGFNSACDMVLDNDYRKLGVDPVIVTMDGSAGMKGLVTDAINELEPSFDYFYTCGPKVMMKAVCETLQGPGQASLEERMGCGCGICYGCTCHTKQGPARVCADGPVFDKEDIIW